MSGPRWNEGLVFRTRAAVVRVVASQGVFAGGLVGVQTGQYATVCIEFVVAGEKRVAIDALQSSTSPSRYSNRSSNKARPACDTRSIGVFEIMEGPPVEGLMGDTIGSIS